MAIPSSAIARSARVGEVSCRRDATFSDRAVRSPLPQPTRSFWRSRSFGVALVCACFCALPPCARAQDIARRALLLDAAVAGADVIAVGERGTIVRSSDAGKTWAAVPTPTDATLTGISFTPDGRRGWAVGHDALILATADAGRTWQIQWEGPDLESSFLDVCALDATNVFAVGAYGLSLTTHDAGKTWIQQKLLDEDMHLNRITQGPTGTLYVAGERGTLLRSNDRGRTWLRIDSPYDGSFYGILPLGPTTLLAYGLRGRVFRSTDDGDNWQSVRVDQPVLLATGLKTTSGTILLAGQSRAFYLSRDGGASFAPAPLNLTDAIAELLEAPDGTVLSFGEAGATRLPPADVAARLSVRSGPPSRSTSAR